MALLISPYHDLVWDQEWPKIVEREREAALLFLSGIVNKACRELGLPLRPPN